MLESIPVQHAAQDLGGHNDATRVGVDRDIPRHQSHILKLLAQLPELLIAQRLHGLSCISFTICINAVSCQSVNVWMQRASGLIEMSPVMSPTPSVLPPSAP